jgi:hypothetical protein
MHCRSVKLLSLSALSASPLLAPVVASAQSAASAPATQAQIAALQQAVDQARMHGEEGYDLIS